MVAASHSYAGTGGAEFTSIDTTIEGYLNGTLGKIIAASMLLVGLGMGMARQSLMAFGVGIGGALGMAAAPTVLTAMFTATLALPDGLAPLAGQPVIDLAHVALALG
jgi:conjugal transfer pilus assembly protein TraA